MQLEMKTYFVKNQIICLGNQVTGFFFKKKTKKISSSLLNKDKNIVFNEKINSNTFTLLITLLVSEMN